MWRRCVLLLLFCVLPWPALAAWVVPDCAPDRASPAVMTHDAQVPEQAADCCGEPAGECAQSACAIGAAAPVALPARPWLAARVSTEAWRATMAPVFDSAQRAPRHRPPIVTA